MTDTPKILITGSRGFVGARAMLHYPGAGAVPGELLRHAGQPLVDFIRAHEPDRILNAAAISDIGACERDPEGSYAANVQLPLLLARAARETGAKLISFSSDQVYTGCEGGGPYREDGPLPTPANLYARHKLEAEQRVLDAFPEAVMLRATWMYDMPLCDHANRSNFLVNTLQAALRGETITVAGGQYRGITNVRQAVGLLDQAFALPGGVYNYGSENPLNMADTARALLSALGLEGRVPVEDSGAIRHNLWMDCGKLCDHGIRFDTTAGGFLRCVQDYGL